MTIAVYCGHKTITQTDLDLDLQLLQRSSLITAVLQLKGGGGGGVGWGVKVKGLIYICCNQSLEPSGRDGSNDRSQHMFSLPNTKNYL